jgi:hypothetical protein
MELKFTFAVRAASNPSTVNQRSMSWLFEAQHDPQAKKLSLGGADAVSLSGLPGSCRSGRWLDRSRRLDTLVEPPDSQLYDSHVRVVSDGLDEGASWIGPNSKVRIDDRQNQIVPERLGCVGDLLEWRFA